MAHASQFFTNLNGVFDPLDGIVSIDKENTIVGHGIGETAVSLLLVAKTHYPTVRMGTTDRNAVVFACQQITGGMASTNIGCSGGGKRSVQSLCTAKSKFQNLISLGSLDNPGGFSGDQSGKIDQVEQG